MNILMLGNSFTYCNDMPGMLAEELNASVTEVVRGGAYLHGFLDQEDELSQLGMAALVGEIHECDGRNMCRTFGGRPCGLWDYVVIQEQSFNAVGFFRYRSAPSAQANRPALLRTRFQALRLSGRGL